MNVRLIAQFTRANVMLTLEYRTGFLILMFNTVAGPTIALLVWLTVLANAGRLPMDRSQLVTYFVLMSAVSMLTMTWAGQYIADEIKTGSLSNYLLRPAPPAAHYIGNNVGEKVIKVWLLLPFVVVVALVFRSDFHPTTEPLRWAAFGIAVVLAGVVAFELDYLIGSLAFWLQDVSGVATLNRLLEGLLAGAFVPLAMFPREIAPLLEVQPWRYVLSFPLEIVTGTPTLEEIGRGLTLAALYAAVLIAAHRLVWRYGLRVYAAVGR
jgi:ABC-2 type transport system permease protein